MKEPYGEGLGAAARERLPALRFDLWVQHWRKHRQDSVFHNLPIFRDFVASLAPLKIGHDNALRPDQRR
jgi:hypothetical protein